MPRRVLLGQSDGDLMEPHGKRGEKPRREVAEVVPIGSAQRGVGSQFPPPPQLTSQP